MTRMNPSPVSAKKTKLNPTLEKAGKGLKALKKGVEYVAPPLEIIGNTNRLKVLLLLSEHERLCVTDLCIILDMSAPALSQHLRKMREAGVVTTKREHKTVFYSIKKKYEDVIRPVLETVNQRASK